MFALLDFSNVVLTISTLCTNLMELAPPRMQTSLRPQLTIYNYTSLKADVDYRLTFGNFINKLYKSILVTPMHGASFFL